MSALIQLFRFADQLPRSGKSIFLARMDKLAAERQAPIHVRKHLFA